MNDWVVETPSFEEDLMNNRVVMLNQNGVNKVVEIIKEKDKVIERLNNIINELNYGIKELDNMFYETFRISQNGYYSISEWELKEFTDKLQELKGSDKE